MNEQEQQAQNRKMNQIIRRVAMATEQPVVARGNAGAGTGDHGIPSTKVDMNRLIRKCAGL